MAREGFEEAGMSGSGFTHKAPLLHELFRAESTGAARKSSAFAGWRRCPNRLAQELAVLYTALKHPEVPWYAKACAAGAVAYDVSPVNLIPDCIPVLGQLDDLLVTLLGLALMKRMIPCELLDICRQQARDISRVNPVNKTVIALLVASWTLSLVVGIVVLRQFWPLHVL
ncbi:MAG: DUF1232 domain-containing protein [Halobacteriota archaeon]